jgi:hypothetical protein
LRKKKRKKRKKKKKGNITEKTQAKISLLPQWWVYPFGG